MDLLLVFTAVGTLGWLWILVLTIRNGEALWSLGCLFAPPLAFAYGAINYKKAKFPLWMVSVGAVMYFIGIF